jgi:hypothetical protein
MSDNQNGSASQDHSGANGQGSNQNESTSGAGDNQSKDDVVKYETYSRVIKDLKKAQSKADELERIIQEQTTKTLKEKEDFKALYENTQAELKKKETELNDINQKIEVSRKYKAFCNYLNEKHGARLADDDYGQLVDLDKIVINPDTGEVDKLSLSNYADDFAKKRSHIIVKTNQAGLPSESPKGGTNTISRNDWLKLSSKEMQKYKPDQII